MLLWFKELWLTYVLGKKAGWVKNKSKQTKYEIPFVLSNVGVNVIVFEELATTRPTLERYSAKIGGDRT